MKLTESILSNLKEEVSEDFKAKVEEIYYSIFPRSKVSFQYGALGGRGTLFINFYLGADVHEEPHGYFDNDLFSCSFRVTGDEIKIIENLSSSIKTKSTEKYLAYGHENVPFRKTTGDESKVLKSLGIYLDRLHDTLITLLHEDKLPDGWDKLAKGKI